MSGTDDNPQTQETKTLNTAKWAFRLAVLGFLVTIYLATALTVPDYFDFDLPKWLLTIIYSPIFHLSCGLVSAWSASLILGVISIVKIRRTKGQLEGIGLAYSAIVTNLISAAIIVGLVLLVIRPATHRVLCGTNLSGLGAVITVYAHDHNNKYPTAQKWCDLLVQTDYVPEDVFVCPGAGAGRSHYAMNPAAEPNSPPDVVLLFETEAGWNQFGGPEIMTAKHHLPRGCNVVFNNTRVRWVKLDKAGKLKWAAQDSGSQPDIHHVIWRGDFNKVLSILTERPELVHEKNIFRWTPLHTAALVGQKEIVQLLLSQGARENSDYRGETPMHGAATKGHKDIVELLLAAGMNPNARNIAAITPLHKAVIRGHKEVVEVLIANGANVNAKDDTGKTPLWYVDEHGEKEIADLLRRHGAVK